MCELDATTWHRRPTTNRALFPTIGPLAPFLRSSDHLTRSRLLMMHEVMGSHNHMVKNCHLQFGSAVRQRADSLVAFVAPVWGPPDRRSSKLQCSFRFGDGAIHYSWELQWFCLLSVRCDDVTLETNDSPRSDSHFLGPSDIDRSSLY